METRARYILIGAFTIAGFIGIVAFILLFSRLQLDRQYDYYDIDFTSVSGLGNASDVRFNGLPVGQVVDVRLSPDRSGTIQVRIEIDADTPVRTDSVATIEPQGVTGVAFVGIASGTPNAPLLVPAAPGDIPTITAGRSTLQTLTEDAPELLDEALTIAREIGSLLGGENQGRIQNILINVENASDEFAQTLNDFSNVAETVTEFAEQISRFNTTLESLTGDITGVLEAAKTTLDSIGELSTQAQTFVSDGSDALVSVRTTVEDAGDYVTGSLTETTQQLQQTLASVREQADVLSADAQALMRTIDTTGTTATAGLQEARVTLQAVDRLIARVDETAVVVTDTVARVDALIEREGGPLLAETRVMVAEATRAVSSVNAAVQTDLPAIIADIRSAADTASTVISEVGENLTSASGRIDGVVDEAEKTLNAATTAFSNANETLSAINGAMETGDRALAAAESAFSGASRVINDDLSGIITGLEQTLATLRQTIGQVSDDIPGISADLRNASASAASAFAELQSMAQSSAPAVETFATTALPAYTRLGQETRELVNNLDRLTLQIERDPARFFLNNETPEFRR
ncbi:MAG: MlaD family protein [Rhodobacteraceae bacterium]|nr:MlaD family protein [Paracoccaceae bacterium]